MIPAGLGWEMKYTPAGMSLPPATNSNGTVAAVPAGAAVTTGIARNAATAAQRHIKRLMFIVMSSLFGNSAKVPWGGLGFGSASR